ncbi:MAG TPA: glycosyltransferase [Acetobacteraceae bacterium]
MTALPWFHRAWRALPAAPRRRLLASTAALLAPRIARPTPVAGGGVIVAGELTRASGLGEGARLMLRALDALGIPNWPLDIGPMLPAHEADLALKPAPTSPPADAALVLHVNAPMLPMVLARLPRALTRGRRIVGYWAWELPVAGPEWRVGGRLVHEAWVPSAFTANALAPLLDGRVRIVPHPLAAVPPMPASMDRAAFGLPRGVVVILVAFNLASSFERKNPLAAIAAFRAAFGERSDRLLVLKVGNPAHAPDDFARLAAAAVGAPNIRLETRTFPAVEAHALTATADIVLSLHRSEGFGLVAAEAMLLGRPVVATGWSGNMDFMDESCAALVGYRLVPASDPRGVYAVAGANWAEPDIAQAADWLRRLADDPALRARLGAAGYAAAQDRLGSAKLADAVRALGVPA